jgi:predicted phosphodiesterase
MLKRILKSLLRGAILACFAFSTFCAQAYTNLAGAYAAMGFDPSAPGNVTVVHLSDPHMNRVPGAGLSLALTTNLDARLLGIVNAMQPPPAKIICSGDETTSFSQVPGAFPVGTTNTNLAILEMHDWLSAISGFTNIAPTNILWVAGNHDQTCLESNAELFCSIFTNMPPYQSFDLAGIRFLLLNSGNYGEPSDSERQWLQAELAATSPTQTVAVFEHYPPFNIPDMYRGMGLMLRQLFANWQARWWTFCGHTHGAWATIYSIGSSNTAQFIVGTENTNMFGGLSHDSGFEFLCLSNGIAGVIYYHYDTASFDVVYSSNNDAVQESPFPSWLSPATFYAVFEDCPGLLWRRNKRPDPTPILTLVSNTMAFYEYLTPLPRTTEPEVILAANLIDSLDWFSYPGEIRWKLQLGLHANQATHFVLGISALSPQSQLTFSADCTNWVEAPSDPWLGGTYVSFRIPPAIAGLPVAYARFQGPALADFIGGWGLSTTNPPPLVTYPQLAVVPNQQVQPGGLLSFTDLATDPYSPPDVLTFTLLSGPPGAAIDPQTGVFSWSPPSAAPLETFSITLKVADNGTPELSATQQFLVTVLGPRRPSLAFAGWQQGRPLFNVSGGSGLNYTVLTSTNLQNWAVLYTTNPPAMPFQIMDPQAPGLTPRFYQVRVSQ